jgi:hypothetical protein
MAFGRSARDFDLANSAGIDHDFGVIAASSRIAGRTGASTPRGDPPSHVPSARDPL